MSPPDIAELQRCLAKHARRSTREWWESYLKGVIPFRGVKMGDIRRCVHGWWSHDGSPQDQRQIAYTLMRQEHTEDKLAGILILAEVLLPAARFGRSHLPELARLFDQGYIYDWNTCDWLCVKALGPLVDDQGRPAAEAVAAWSSAANLWRRRAAAVAFVNLAPAGDGNFGGFTDLLIGACARLVADPERFAQTGAAWPLRELSLAEPGRVTTFVETHHHRMSGEAIRSATAKLDPPTQARLAALPPRRPGKYRSCARRWKWPSTR